MFTIADLLISDAEQAAITSALASAGQADPIGAAMEEAAAKVGAICDPYDLPAPWPRRLIRALVLFELYSRVGNKIPDHVQRSYDEACKDLQDIRDARYSHFLRTGSGPASSSNVLAVGRRRLSHSRQNQEGI